MNTGKRIREEIINIESMWPVDSWMINGVHVWPIIRIQLYIYLLNEKSERLVTTKMPSILPVVKKGRKINLLLKSIKGAFKIIWFFYNLKPKKIVFFGSHFHRSLNKGKYFNRFFDPMIDFHKLHDSVYIVEFQRVMEKNYNQKGIIALHFYLNDYKLLKKIFLSLRKEKLNLNLDGFEGFHNYLKKEYPKLAIKKISEEHLLNLVLKINSTKGFFIKMYGRIKPKKVILLSSYGFDDLYAAILACKELKIKSIDFQHGPQTNMHMAYSCWTKVPKDGYNILPDEYWCWDEYSKENIEKWAYRTKINALNVGNPYVSFFMLKNKQFFDSVHNKLLFSLQLLPLEKLLPTKFLQVIKEEKLFMEIRKHPRNTFSDNDIKEFLTLHGIPPSYYEITDSYTKPLPLSLSETLLHVTNFSGCVLEANSMKVPTLLIHEIGYEMFLNYIDDELVFYYDFIAPFEENISFFKEIIKKSKKLNRHVINDKIYNPLT